jgi:hypothetical protein
MDCQNFNTASSSTIIAHSQDDDDDDDVSYGTTRKDQLKITPYERPAAPVAASNLGNDDIADKCYFRNLFPTPKVSCRR